MTAPNPIGSRERAEAVAKACRHIGSGHPASCVPCIARAIEDAVKANGPSHSGFAKRFARALVEAFDSGALEPHTVADCPADDTCTCRRAKDINAAAKYLAVAAEAEAIRARGAGEERER